MNKRKHIRKLVKDGFISCKPNHIHSPYHARRMTKARLRGFHSGYVFIVFIWLPACTEPLAFP
ncbi:hypothetical protein C5167_034552, partial [Papaver somniferum]